MLPTPSGRRFRVRLGGQRPVIESTAGITGTSDTGSSTGTSAGAAHTALNAG